jgi:hypothetical protein
MKWKAKIGSSKGNYYLDLLLIYKDTLGKSLCRKENDILGFMVLRIYAYTLDLGQGTFKQRKYIKSYIDRESYFNSENSSLG